VDQLFDHTAFLIEARGRQRASFNGIKNSQQMLALAKNDLRGSHCLAFTRISYQIGTSHILSPHKFQEPRDAQLP
jgi:hypothetical protein